MSRRGLDLSGFISAEGGLKKTSTRLSQDRFVNVSMSGLSSRSQRTTQFNVHHPLRAIQIRIFKTELLVELDGYEV